MSEDWLLRTNRAVMLDDVVAALMDEYPHLGLRSDSGRRNVVVVDETDTALVWIGPARRVADPSGAAGRAGLGPSAAPARPGGSASEVTVGADEPDDGGLADEALWTEITGPASRQVGGAGGARFVGAVARGVARVMGGEAVRWSAAPMGEVDAVRPRAAGIGAEDVPVDIVGSGAGLLLQSRPVVTLTPWLVEATSWAARTGRGLGVLTPATSLLSHAAATALDALSAVWVVDAGDEGLRDGLRWVPVTWDGANLVRVPVEGAIEVGMAPSAGDAEGVVELVSIEAECLHAYDAPLTVGLFAEACLAAVRGPRPTAQGLMEPLEARYDPEELTESARRTSPAASRLLLSAPGMSAVLSVIPQPPGVVERLQAVVAPTSSRRLDDLDAAALDRIAADVITAGANRAVIGRRMGTRQGHIVPGHGAYVVPAMTVADLRRYPGVGVDEALAAAGSDAHLVGDVLVAHHPSGVAEAFTSFLRLAVLLDGHDSHGESAHDRPGA